MKELNDILKNERETYKIIFFISDGEVVNSEELASYSNLKKYVDGGAVLGYGTTAGGAMRPLKYVGDEETLEYLYYYDEDYNSVKAISKIDEGNLKQIASDLGVKYVHMTKQSKIDSQIDKLQSEISKNVAYSENDSKNGYKETYYWFAIPLVFLMIFDYIYFSSK